MSVAAILFSIQVAFARSVYSDQRSYKARAKALHSSQLVMENVLVFGVRNEATVREVGFRLGFAGVFDGGGDFGRLTS